MATVLFSQARFHLSHSTRPRTDRSQVNETWPGGFVAGGTMDQTRRFLGGRHPLWGRGVTSSIALMDSPEACSAVMALSRPEPGPFTFTSTSLTPYLVAAEAAVSAARWAANGVLLRLPLKPTVPDEAQHNASPLGSVIVTNVLLNVAFTCTIARLTLRRVLRFLALATEQSLPESR